MQALNNNATMTRSIYPITQNILQADIGNHSLIPRLLLNSTKPKDYARNAREERCEVCGVCVCSNLYPPCIYSREPRVRLLQPTSATSGEATRGEVEAMGPMGRSAVGRPASGANHPQPPLVGCPGLPCLVHVGLGLSWLV